MEGSLPCHIVLPTVDLFGDPHVQDILDLCIPVLRKGLYVVLLTCQTVVDEIEQEASFLALPTHVKKRWIMQ
jgi:hypothetical protein